MIKQLTDHEHLVSSQYENQIVSRNLLIYEIQGILAQL